MKKTCNKCGVDKLVSEYHRAARNLGGYCHTCKECRKEIDSDYYRTSEKKEKSKEYNKKYKKRNLERLRRYKAECGCILCKKEFEPIVLDFHHKDDNKEFTIASKTTCSWDRLLIEIKKCVVLCSNCHRKVHAGILKL
jgi:hypothetical protein